MFAVTYRIRVRPDQRQAFSVCWRTIAEAKRDHCGSLGSELFVQSDGSHVVLERWPDKDTYDRCSLPENYVDLDGDMHGLCTEWEETGQLEQAESVTT
ncbi:MAG: antibiotic biosynthesis monooxygenase [Actinomycetota bacterium]